MFVNGGSEQGGKLERWCLYSELEFKLDMDLAVKLSCFPVMATQNYCTLYYLLCGLFKNCFPCSLECYHKCLSENLDIKGNYSYSGLKPYSNHSPGHGRGENPDRTDRK